MTYFDIFITVWLLLVTIWQFRPKRVPRDLPVNYWDLLQMVRKEVDASVAEPALIKSLIAQINSYQVTKGTGNPYDYIQR